LAACNALPGQRIRGERRRHISLVDAVSRSRHVLDIFNGGANDNQQHLVRCANAMVMWDEIAAEVAKEFPDVTWDKMLVDAMTMRMTMRPQTLDTIVATNYTRIFSLISPQRLPARSASRRPQI
jgi:hypothetical protein